ncbi:MAG TPA: HAMP domain-containing sensor histidine kinase [Kiloniellaceae bacterium]|nr:HAMP domain-containing sensor histidine kinase [Kiloniellaceae bacterium]
MQPEIRGPQEPGAKRFALPPLGKSLSVRLLLLTIGFVMLAEVLIYCPSIARFRLAYLQERLASAHLALLALEATPDQMVSEAMEQELMSHVDAYAIALLKPDSGRLMLMVEKPTRPVVTYKLTRGGFFSLIRDAFVTLASDEDRLLRVLGPSPQNPKIEVEVVMDEAPLRLAMLDFSQRILNLSLVISLFTAALVYLSLHYLMVRPLRRITQSMVAFRTNPEDASRDIAPSGRSDEVGVVERELVTMQEGLRGALLQKTRLAALGTAVTKINHDLRNILSAASLLSDRLSRSEDPAVRDLVPLLVSTLDRAVTLCRQTLSFTREGPRHLDISSFSLAELVEEVVAHLPEAQEEGREIETRFDRALTVEADRDEFYRIFHNLIQNALLAGAGQIMLSTGQSGQALWVDFADDGSGLPPRARANLFQPFAGSARKGGTGLGLAIARDLARAHGGELELVKSDAAGTTFRLHLKLPASN